ncbi:hypothetical protein AADG42_03955 [Ammonicoccus fulvus]|uniref:protein-tyrosine-phosphatase n=1 Tax=Ammonicoccus fulvus TaxID=3138240 RepID=A0ABZ3FNQ6_9ACTN
MTVRMLFVCTANISRSPYAERRARMLDPERRLLVGSAGVPGMPGRPMDPEMARQLVDRGGSAEGHVSQSVNEDMLAFSDVVLSFEFAQHLRILEEWPQYAARVFGIGQFADAVDRLRQGAGPRTVTEIAERATPDSMGWDVDDPYRRGRRAARAAAARIDGHLMRIIPALTGTEPT